MATERTWQISDIDGKNRRTVTLAQYRAEIEAAKIVARARFLAAADAAGLGDGARRILRTK